MRILLAAPRGFCAGVNMAIESLRLAVEQFGTPIYVYHEIVHNRWVVDRFRAAGRGVCGRPGRGSPGCPSALLGPRGVARGPREGSAAPAADDRRHVPAGHQAARRGDPVCAWGLYDHSGRAPGPRRSGRRDGRSARGDQARRTRGGHRPSSKWRTPSGWPISHRQRSRSTRRGGSLRS